MDKFRAFLQQYRVKSYSKGEVILFEGEEPSNAYVIKSGVVKTYNITNEGQEKPISFDVEDDVMPAGWVFGKIKLTQYYYEAFTDCELYVIPRNDYINKIKSDPDLLFLITNQFVRRYIQFQMRVNALEQSKAVDKVLYTIYFLCHRFGRELKNDVVKIELALTQQDMANFMGLTRETTGIELKKLEKAGVISYGRQKYIVKTDKLNELISEEYGNGAIIDEEENAFRVYK